ncbi:hypothetical protein [Effusibacillus consociatus]|uniref:Lipoprotein n=1 Tax=Effusibacillus consociatus TaxID=1117041 RepID=A0ABV9Q0J8_9BACL
MKVKARCVFVLAAAAALTAGCQPLSAWTPALFNKPAVSATSPKTTFDKVLEHTQANPLKGKVLAEMKGLFDPGLLRFAFVTSDGRPIFVYEESNGTVNLAIMAQDGTVKHETFPGYKLQKAVLNQKILYIGFKDSTAIKYNTDSFHYSEVDKSEMEHSRVVLDEFKLPGKEDPVHTQEGYVYTKEGFIFDRKNHEYLLAGQTKKKFYEKADFAYGSYLFELEPRLDQAVNLKAVKAQGDKTVKGKTYGIHLDLPEGYNVKHLDHAIGYDGQLFLFAMGAEEQGKLVIKMFAIPLGSFEEKQ